MVKINISAFLVTCCVVITSFTNAPVVSALSSNTSTIVNTTVITPYFEGWGTSLAWWAEFAGGLDRCKLRKLINMIFSRNSYPSLGFNIVRYNIGGSPPVDNRGFAPADPLMGQYRGVPSYQLSPNVWNWSSDANQRRVMAFAKTSGVNIFEAFSNSPPWWMTISKTSRGSYNGSDNLAPSNYTLFAEYLSSVVLQLRNTYGFNITSLEPFNEPNGYWWVASTTQSQSEGCGFRPASQKAFLPYLNTSMTSKGLSNLVDVSSADEFAYNWAMFNLWNGADYSLTNKANVHGYGFTNTKQWNQIRAQWRAAVPQRIKRYWISEVAGFGQSDSGIVNMVSNTILDLNLGRITAWIYWQVLDSNSDWSLIRPNSACNTCFWWDASTFDPAPTPAFYALMQLTNYIRPGSMILSSSRSADLDTCIICVVVAFNPSTSRLSIVATNNDNSTTFTHMFDLSLFAKSISRTTIVSAYRTSVNRNEFHVAVTRPVVETNRTFIYPLMPLSITSFVLNNVTLS